MAHISVVTPVYKAEDCLHELYRRLVSALAGITQDFEIVMVEDCGGDRSWEIIRELAQKDPRVKGIQFSRNMALPQGWTIATVTGSSSWTATCRTGRRRFRDCMPKLRRALTWFSHGAARGKIHF